jgi:hypothetical protein
MGMYRNVQLWQSLPAKAEFEFQERGDILALDKEMEMLSVQLSKASGSEEKHHIQLKQHKVYNEKKRLYTEQLKSLQKSQPNKPRVHYELRKQCQRGDPFSLQAAGHAGARLFGKDTTSKDRPAKLRGKKST